MCTLYTHTHIYIYTKRTVLHENDARASSTSTRLYSVNTICIFTLKRVFHSPTRSMITGENNQLNGYTKESNFVNYQVTRNVIFKHLIFITFFYRAHIHTYT